MSEPISIGGYKGPYIPPALPFDESQLESMGLLDDWERLPRIVEWFDTGCLTAEQLNRLLSEWWTNGGYPEGMGIPRLLQMLKTAGFITDAEGPAERPTEPLTIYRGARPGRHFSFCWSTDYDVAAWFAHRYTLTDLAAVVYTTTIPPRHVLGLFNDREEAEVVVNPYALRWRAITSEDAQSDRVHAAAYRRVDAVRERRTRLEKELSKAPK